MTIWMVTVNTQAQTHAQIPAYVQLPTLFQPHVPLQPSAHLCCNQTPCPAMISINPLCSAEMLTISHKPRIIPRMVMRWLHLIFWPQLSWQLEVNQVYWKDHSPSAVPIQFLYFLLTHSCFNTPDPHHPCSTWPWVTWSFWSRLLFICDLLSIKAAPLLYYTSVLILTKITTVLFFQDPYWTRLRGLMKFKDWDCL